MARRDREGKRWGTMTTTSCKNSARPQLTNADHITSHGGLRPNASLLLASSSPSGSQVPSRPSNHGDPARAG
ncbi:hypothetical protein GUJ93_ZPchr0013g34855 [Zizania palustris]|uniref:Uncharacterized protein n=1 Tax=Zizania palustris TaxID=103762 RepID=A0A8J5WWB6_ZIZPA|nr:hypothetical protein GUJ93_ZPchr0013g34855 [Zizania palustris]